METTCQASYPRNSENASPPGTFKAYLSWADMAPLEALTSAVTIAIVRMRWLFITSSSFVKLGGLATRVGCDKTIHLPQHCASGGSPGLRPGSAEHCSRSGERLVLCRRGFARCRNETMPRKRPARRMLEPCCLANPRPRTRSYGYGGADLLHGRPGARAPRRRQPVRNGSRGAAGGDRSPHGAPECSTAVARCPQGVPPGPAGVAGARQRVRHLLGNTGRVGTAGSLRRPDRRGPDARLA